MSSKEVVDARQTRIDADAAWALLKSAAMISVAKGRKVQNFTPAVDGRETVLQQVMGPSGNLRAPTLRSGDRFFIGFNADLYADWLK